ncbi:MAG: NAD-dependent epimerase/dehydratase family protein [Candidatus Omnitrophica bacterium]|nr:NAD-dependent epimerase/dehydratase family protein [Candidatus Omnitrophota bacterium]
MYLEDKTVFLAGATGMAGSAILKRILDHYPDTRIKALYHHTEPFITDKRITYVHGDLRSEGDLGKMMSGCDCAIMAAASTGGVGQSGKEPWKQVNNNLIMNARMLEAFHFAGVKRVIYIGSATLYQDSDKPIKENDLDLGKDPNPSYMGVGWVSRYLEKLCKFWHDQTGMEVILVRASNIFGPYAKFDPQNSNFIPAIVRKAVDKIDPFEVWGSPNVVRDVIYSEDFARAIVKMADNSNIKYEVFNLGSGQETSVKDIVDWALKYSGHEPSSINYDKGAPTTIKYRVLDCSKIRKMLGWQPEYSVEEAVKQTVEWWKENKEWWKK